jgi:hypothetical protein
LPANLCDLRVIEQFRNDALERWRLKQTAAATAIYGSVENPLAFGSATELTHLSGETGVDDA